MTREVVRFVEVKQARGTRVKAAHAFVVGTMTISLLSLAFGVPLALTGMTGIFVAISAFDRSQRSRIRVLSALALGYTVLVALGALTALLPTVLGVVAVAALATVTAFAYHSLLSDPPGPMLLIMGICAASYIPTLGVPIPLLVAITALAMVIGCTTSIVMQLGRRRAAVHRQVSALATAVADLERAWDGQPATADAAPAGDPGERSGPVDLGRLRDAAFGALFQAQSSLVASLARGRPPGADAQRLEDEIHALHLRLFRVVARHELPWTRLDDDAVADHYLGAPRIPYLLAWSLSSASPAWLAARRTGLAVLLGGGFSSLFHLDHPYWAQMTAALVLSTASDRVTSTVRAEHRVAGTAAGVGLFFGLHLLHLHPAAVAATVVVCASLTQVLAPRHYALATMVMTPMPLLMAAMHVTSDHVGSLMWSRVLETVIGSAAALLVLWLQGQGTAVVLVRRQFRRALVALHQVVRLMAADPDEAATPAARRNLHFEQLAAAKVLAMVRTTQSDALADWPTVESALGEITYTVLVAARTRSPGTALRWTAMAQALESYLATLPAVSATPVDADAVAGALRGILALGRPEGHSGSGPQAASDAVASELDSRDTATGEAGSCDGSS